jgi:hypothetical protein
MNKKIVFNEQKNNKIINCNVIRYVLDVNNNNNNNWKKMQQQFQKIIKN